MGVRHVQWTAVVHRNSICAAFTESRMVARHKGDTSARGNQTNLTQRSVDCRDCTSCYLNFIDFHRNSGPVIYFIYKQSLLSGRID